MQKKNHMRKGEKTKDTINVRDNVCYIDVYNKWFLFVVYELLQINKIKANNPIKMGRILEQSIQNR